MTTFVQLHLLTFVPPANLNRDDTGAPKSAIVGGETRLRLSSQSLKRAWRTSDVLAERLAGHLGSRTQRFGEEMVERLVGDGVAPDVALAATRKVIVAFGKPKGADDPKPARTEQLAFLSPDEKEEAVSLAAAFARGETIDDKAIAARVLKRADTAADIAMFGRMFADHPDFNREAAVQVAHAFTTHRVEIEDDFYTAVDDLNRREENVGAGFVGEAGFGSGVFYLYVCIDTGLLTTNLGGDLALARSAVCALVEAAATVAPNGKQASFASRVRASHILVEKGPDQPRTLAAAFAEGVSPRDPKGILTTSSERLVALRDAFAVAYGAGDTTAMEMRVGDPVTRSLADLVAFASDFGA